MSRSSVAFTIVIGLGLGGYAHPQSRSVEVIAPTNGAILRTDRIEVRGSISSAVPPNTIGKLRVDSGDPIPFQIPDGKTWRVLASVTPGDRYLLVTVPAAKEARLIITVPSDPRLPSNGSRLQVFLEWERATLQTLDQAFERTLAPATYNDPLRADKVREVPDRVKQLLEATFAEFGIAFALGPATGDGHVVRFVPTADVDQLKFGRTEPVKCGHSNPNGSSEILVGTLRDVIMQDWTWAPMTKYDSLDLRKEDVARALTHSAAHEILHATGLVSCDWMNPDQYDKFHNSPNDKYYGTRFGAGRHLSDSGVFVFGGMRIGETGDRRLPARQPATLSAFDVGYLQIVHPRESAASK